MSSTSSPSRAELHDGAVGDQPAHLALADHLAVAGELHGPAEVVGHLAVRRGVDVRALLGGRVGLGPLALLVHQVAEADLVDLQPLLGRHLQGQVDREAVGVVQGERPVPTEHVATGLLHLLRREVEDLRAGLEGLAERVLLGVGDLRDPVPVTEQLAVGLSHLVPADRQEVRQHAVLGAEQPHRAHRAAQQPAQHVAATLVAGRHAVGDQHHRAADVVGDDPEPDVVLPVVAVPLAGQLLGLLDDGVHHVDLVHVVDALQQVRHPLQAHARVDVLLRQRAGDVEVLLGPDPAQHVLHEDEVPDLEIPVLELGRHEGPLGGLELTVRPVLRAAVVEDLRARTARARDAHRPVVLLGPELDDPLGRQPGHLHPDLQRLVVALQDRGPQPALLQAEAAVSLRLGDQVPRELDRAFLEVVAEGEVAAHLEERAVPSGLADVLDVRCTHALLHADRTVVRRRLLAEEVRLERHHPRGHEQESRVVEDQRRRRHGGVSGPLEVSHEPPPDLRGVHQSVPSLSSVG